MSGHTSSFLSELADRIVHHSRDNHMSSFNKPKAGTPLNINNDPDLKQHILDILKDPDTRGFTAAADDKKMYFYNEKTNTI
jgi:hypothetical protein